MASRIFARKVGRIVRDRRKHLGMTQNELASRSGTSVRFIISLELGESSGVRLDKLVQVLDVLGLSLDVSEEAEGAAAERTSLHSLLKESASKERDKYARAFQSVVENLGRTAE